MIETGHETPDALRWLPERFQPRTSTLLYGAALVNAEVLLVAAYLLASGASVDDPFGLVYPFVWINVGLWAIVRTDPVARERRHRRLVGVVAGVYLLALFVLGGMLWTAHPEAPTGFDVSMLTPGVGPVLAYNGTLVRFTLVPFLVVGYAALAYLVYATLLDAAGSAIGGVVGLFSCLSCVWPLIAPIFVGAFGSAGAAAATSLQSYVAGTAIFLATVALLYWRPFKREHEPESEREPPDDPRERWERGGRDR
ncbi:DUF7546 family protein [Halalkalicoccus ordinarius]|uniref:DUF7546 family protein n=1 Tax=Halalkalicoccus ordinarius TaxID=3116651 RepID=UPI00300E899B